MDDPSLALPLPQPGSLKLWLHVPRLRLGIIYEQRVARIRRDRRICERHTRRGPIGDNKNTFITSEAQWLQERGDLFLERCRQEWLNFHIMGTLLSGYETPISTSPCD